MKYLKYSSKTIIFFTILCLFKACDSVESGRDKTSKGAKYYISLKGDNTNPGTKSQPWRSISKLNETDFQPGDHILFEGGSVFVGTIVLDENDKATAKSNISISSFGEGHATIDAGDSLALKADNCDHLTIQKLVFMGSGRLAGNTSDGVFLSDCDGINLSELEVYGFQHSGIHVHKSTGAGITHIYAHNNGFSGIHVTGTTIGDPENYDNGDIYIGYCVAENNPGDPTVLANHSGNGILASSVDGGIIEYCEASTCLKGLRKAI